MCGSWSDGRRCSASCVAAEMKTQRHNTKIIEREQMELLEFRVEQNTNPSSVAFCSVVSERFLRPG